MTSTKKLRQGPLKCWDLYAMYLSNQAVQFNKELELETLRAYAREHSWLFDFEGIIYNTEFDAIILTNTDKSIEWVNKGFTKMTGYTAKYAIGKKPVFLQGNETSNTTLKRISNLLKNGNDIKETIINYRKNGQIYNCTIEIYPLTNSNKDITHFVAFERETRF